MLFVWLIVNLSISYSSDIFEGNTDLWHMGYSSSKYKTARLIHKEILDGTSINYVPWRVLK